LTKYEIILYWSPDDNAFIAEVPELAGCMADGETRADALENVERMIPEWIEAAKELGRDIPVPKGRRKNADKQDYPPIPDDEATPDDLEAITEARAEYAEGETVASRAINWS